MPTTAVWQLRSEARFRALISLAALLGFLALGFVLLAFVISFVSPTPAIATPETRVHAGNVDDFSVGQPVYFKDGDFWLIREANGSFMALLARDTKVSVFDTGLVRCPLRWLPDYRFATGLDPEQRGFFKADCSGSVFSIDGKTVFGPSPRDLDARPIVVSATGEISVITSKDRIISGGDRSRR